MHMIWHNAVVFLAAVLAAGCSSSKTAPVRGQIVYLDGQPAGKELENYLVTFESEDGRTGGTGNVRADGSFEISTFTEGDGALLGAQRVAITPPYTTEGTMARSVLDARYARLDTSGLVVTIGKGENRVKLEVERRQRSGN